MNKFFLIIFVLFAFLIIAPTETQAANQPDLVIVSVNFDPAKGYSIPTIKNLGNATAVNRFSVSQTWLMLDESPTGVVGTIEFAGNIAPGQTQTPLLNQAETVKSAWLPQDRAVKVILKVDFDNKIAESNEGNNEKIFDRALPDLKIGEVIFDPVTLKPSVKVVNSGTFAVTKWGDTQVGLYLLGSDGMVIPSLSSEKLVSSVFSQSLAAGDSFTVAFDKPITQAAVRYSAYIKAMYNLVPLDVNESNDLLEGNVPELFPADLVIVEPVIFSDQGYAKPVVRNQGVGDAGGFFVRQTWLRSDGSETGTSVNFAYDGIAAGGIRALRTAAQTATNDWLPPRDAVKVQLIIDPLNTITESNKDNNETTPDRPLPDLTVVSASLTPEAFTYTVRNLGSGRPTAYNGNIALYWLKQDKTPIFGAYYSHQPFGFPENGEVTIRNLGDADSQSYRFFWGNVPTEARFLRVQVGYGPTSILGTSNTPESNTENNSLEIDRPLLYPVPELGNCTSKENCKLYCQQPENASACAEFGRNRGLLTEEEAEAAEELNEISEETPGPGNCTTKESCAEFCEAPANIEACLNYAEQNHWMSADDLSKARKVAGVLQSGGVTPGSCNTPSGCKNYCSDNTHAVECVNFGKTVGLLTAEEAAEAEKVAPLMQSGQMPGGKTSKEEIEAYCENNREECDKFFEQAGVKKGKPPKGEEPKENAPSIFEGKEGGGPGGCKTKAECDAYCDAHPGECDQAVIEAGGEVKEATALCSTREECEAFCNEPANKEAEACTSGTIIIKEEPPESAGPTEGPGEDPLEKLRSDIQEIISQSQSQDCVKQILGEEVFTKFVIEGGIPEKAISMEELQPCFEEAKRVIEQQEMLKMQKKPDDPDMGNPPPSGKASTFLASIINILGWFNRINVIR